MVQELRDKIVGGGHIVAVDTRWSRAKRPCDSCATAHILLVVFYDSELDLAGVPGREAGRSPLPDIEHVRDVVRRWGVRSKHPVIVYGAGDGLFALRAWWILRWAGLENMHVPIGGLAVWEANGSGVAFGPGNLSQPGTVAMSEGNMPAASPDDVRTWSERGTLVDVREPSRSEGRSERVNLQAGHIPGAVNLAARSLQNADDSFLPVEQLRGRFVSIGIEDGHSVAVYSGSGLHSPLLIQAMAEAGITGVSLYVGGWPQWAGDPSRPITRF